MHLTLPWPPSEMSPNKPPTSREWTAEQIAELRAAYESAEAFKGVGLDGLAAKFGRLKSNVCRKARELGLTRPSRKKREGRKVKPRKFATLEEAWAQSVRRLNEWRERNGHPRGALGMRHSEETKRRIAEQSRAMNARRTPEQVRDYTIKGLQTKTRNGTYAPMRKNTTWKSGWREIGGVRKFYRSKWEANYARYLEWQKSNGLIADWKHEPTTFWFVGIKRGSVSYLPDFLVRESDGSECYHEVKGWMDARSRTKIRRMAKYHPQVRLVVIDGKRYADLAKKVAGLVPEWEA